MLRGSALESLVDDVEKTSGEFTLPALFVAVSLKDCPDRGWNRTVVTILIAVDVRGDSGTVRLSIEAQPCQCLQVRLCTALDEFHDPAIVDEGADKFDVSCECSEVAWVAKSHISEEVE